MSVPRPNRRPPPGGRWRLAVAGLCAAGFTAALLALVTAQLALMSILDAGRTERAADQIAESEFTADVIEQAVTRAVAPVAGDDVAERVAAAASADDRVTDVVAESLTAAHRQLVDPEAPATVADGNLAVGVAIVDSMLATATANGIDPATLGLTGANPAGDDTSGGDPAGGDTIDGDTATVDAADIAGTAGLPSIVPEDPPRLGLRRAAETTRTVALLAAIAFAVLAVVVHPRPGRSLRSVGAAVAVITGAWLIGLLVVGFVIDRVSDTLFGEMLDAVWSDAVPSMLLLVGAGVVIGIGLLLAGLALDGLAADRRRLAGRPPGPAGH